MGCLGRSGARQAGCGRKRLETPVPGGSRRSWGGAAGMPTRCAILCASTWSRRLPNRIPSWWLTRQGCASRARPPAAWLGSTPALRARSPTARSGCSLPMSRGAAMPLSIGPSICPRPGPMIRRAGRQRTCRRRLPLRPSHTLRAPWSSGRSRRGGRSPGGVAAGVASAWVGADSIYGVSELDMALRQAGKGYVLGVAATSQFNSWGAKPAVAGTAAEIASALDPSAWRRLSAGAGAQGERLFDWAYLELADLEAAEYNQILSDLWTRGLLIRRNITDGELAFFATWCPAGTGMETLVAVEGRRWAIEDGFETAKNELGLDHNETRSWYGWHRHVSLVMLAFAVLAAIRRKANTPAPPKSSLTMIRKSRR